MDLSFLTPLLDRTGPWASVYLDTSRATEDAAQRRALIDRAAVNRLGGAGADERTCVAVRDRLAAEPAADSPPGRALFAADGDVALDVPLAVSPPDVAATWAPLPHTAPLLGLLDDAMPRCLVAAVDRTGAELERCDLGRMQPAGAVEAPQWQGRGHRAPPADRYEWHYRHRVEDAWDRTASIIADHLARVWPESGADLLVLAGGARERRAVHDRLPQQLRAVTVEVDGGGRAAGIDRDAFDRQIREAWADHRAGHLDTVLGAFQAGLGRPGEHGTDGAGTETAPGAAAQGVPAVVSAARQHQLAALLVQEGGGDPERPVWIGPSPEHIGVQRADVRAMGVDHPELAPAADALLRAATAAGAEALLVPEASPGPPGGVGAVLRWAA
ncbi:hypothetical protein RMN57_02075 [Kitasatospora sp. CM 4170]|uniref:Peptide chain release factor 1 n=1 Tax=Kitasatospora aburaviensis TaxID=67265 RepID=A0ABW1F9Y7_9ACTN|nr:hypothetical protein [Kitasatospora sp. CM 4170]WNM43570.1 hypothetical protein RMN57_02075 [Kitasatospora sp. CM 4170]